MLNQSRQETINLNDVDLGDESDLTNKNRKILIVDDQQYNIMALKTILRFSVGIQNIEQVTE